MRHYRNARTHISSFPNRRAGLAAAGIFAALLFSGPGPEAANEEIVAGITSGQFKVDASGQASYTLPIEVPPGRNGHQPEISIDYNSGSNDGYIGYGFHVSGLPRIHRCPRTEFHDGESRGVRFDQNDALCLDGARLILVSGTHGAQGARYRSYQESWTRITITSVKNSTYRMPDNTTRNFSGPGSFEVVQKDGTTLLFGTTMNSKILAGNGQVNIWALTSMSDRFGNTINYAYINNSLRSQKDDYSYYPQTLTYGNRRVVFFYGEREAAQTYTRYVPYTPVKNGLRLQKIQIQYRQSTFKQYNFTYTRRATIGVDLVDTIQECAGNQCFRPTKFTWGDNPASGINPNAENNVSVFPLYFSNLHEYESRPLGVYADFNGDGIPDFSPAMKSQNGTTDYTVHHGTGTGFKAAGYQLPNNIYKSKGTRSKVEGVLRDINGDGLPDYSRATCFKSGNCQLKVYHGTGAGFVDSGYLLPKRLYYNDPGSMDNLRQEGVLLDMNGDGRLDLIHLNKVYLHTGSGFSATPFKLPRPIIEFDPNSYAAKPGGVLQDFNGDGIMDFSRATSWQNNALPADYRVYHGTGAGFVDAGYKLPDKVYHTKLHSYLSKVEGVLRDINGDGLPDYSRATCFKPGNICNLKVYHGTGAGFVDSGYFLPGQLYYNDGGSMHNLRQEGVLQDLNGDGRLDLIRFQRVYYHTGKGYSGRTDLPHTLIEFDNSSYATKRAGLLLDFNGDGLPDFSRATRWSNNQTRKTLHLNRWYGAPRIERIAEAHAANNKTNGRIRDIQYMRLNDPQPNPKWPGGTNVDRSIHYGHDNEPTPARYVVSSFQEYDLSGRVGHIFETAYQYAYLKSARDGRGFLGFAAIDSYETHTGLRTRRAYQSEHYPYHTIPARVTVSKSGNTIHDSQYTFSDNLSGTTGIQFRVVTKEEHTTHEGSTSVTTRQTYSHDAYGNVTQIGDLGSTQSAADDLYTCSSYINDTTNWRLGFANSIKTASNAGCGSGLLSHQKFSFDQKNNRFELSSMKTYDNTGNGRWLEESYAHDTYGNRTQTIDSAGVETNIVYETDDHTYPATETVQKGNLSLQTSYEYSPRYGRMTSRTDANGHTFTTQMDAFGRRTAQKGPGDSGQVTLDEWSYRNEATGVSIARRRYSRSNQSVVIREFVDAFDRNYGTENVASESGSKKIEQATAFDTAGRPMTVEAPHYAGATTGVGSSSVAYDDQGRPTSITQVNGAETTTDYSVNTSACAGCTLQESIVRDANSSSKVTLNRVRDARGNPRKITHGNGSVQNFAYDAAGRVTLMSDGKAQTVFQYDTVGRKVFSHYAQASNENYGKVRYKYNDAGRLVEIKDSRASRNTLTISYDDLGRIIKRAFSGGRVVHYIYGTPGNHTTNSIGRLQAAYVEINEVENSRYTFAYDPYGRVIQTDVKYTDSGNKQHSYSFGRQYDLAGNATRVVYPDATEFDRTFTSRGLITQLSYDGTDYATYSDFTAAGQARNIVYSNGLTHQRTYDAADQLKTSKLSRDTTDLLDQAYAYNGLFFPTAVTDNLVGANTQSFEYDKGGYLKQADGPYGQIKYEYDIAGNLTKKGNTQYTYDGHRLTKHDQTTYKYDGAGNRTQKKDNGANKTWDYVYSAEGMLNKVSVNGSVKLRNLYGPFSERIERRDTVSKRRSIYFMDLMDVVVGNNQDQHTIYLNGPDGRVAAITRNGLPPQTGSASISPLLLTGMYGNNTAAHIFKRLEIRANYLIGRPGAAAFLKFSVLAVFAAAVLVLFLYYRRERMATRGPSPYRRRMAAFAPALSILFVGFFVLQCHNDAGGADDFWDDVAAAFGLESAVLSALQNGATNDGIPTVNTTRFYHQDSARSTAMVTNDAGDVTARILYEPYGKIHNLSGDNDFRPKFAQKEFDEESGLYHFGARFYDPAVGRFISADNLAIGGPSEAPGIQNRYQYAGNNPVSYQDPDGNFFWFIALAPLLFLTGVTVGVQLTGAILAAKNDGNFRGLGQFGLVLLGFVLGFGIASVTSSLALIAAAEITLGVIEGVAIAAIEGKTGTDLLLAGAIGGGVGAAGFGASSAISGGLNSVSRIGRSTPKASQCFAAGTLVETERGLRPIETIQVGDRVLSRKDDATGETEYKEVTELFITPDKEIGDLVLTPEQGSAETLKVTAEHPFFVRGRGWVDASELQAGDFVAGAQNARLRVATAWQRTGTAQTYNFEVAEFHTYYVSEQRIWVHNTCNPKDLNRSSFRRGTKRKAEERATRVNAQGEAELACVYCSRTIEKYDLDHQLPWKRRKAFVQADPEQWSRKDVLDLYNFDLRVSCPSCNRSHRFENWGDWSGLLGFVGIERWRLGLEYVDSAGIVNPGTGAAGAGF